MAEAQMVELRLPRELQLELRVPEPVAEGLRERLMGPVLLTVLLVEELTLAVSTVLGVKEAQLEACPLLL